MSKFSSGNGVFFNGVASRVGGIPSVGCEWYQPSDEKSRKGVGVSACTDGTRLFHSTGRKEYEFIEIDIKTGEHQVIFSEEYDSDSSGCTYRKIGISGNYILYGTSLYNLIDLKIVRDYQLTTTGQLNDTQREQTISALDDGFLFFSGGLIYKVGRLVDSRVLYHIDLINSTVIEHGSHDVVLPCGENLLFSISGRSVFAREWRSDKVLWEATIVPRYDPEFVENYGPDESSVGYTLRANKTELFVCIPFDGIHRFDAKNGEYLGYVEYTCHRLRKYGQGYDQCFVTDDMLYIFCYSYYGENYCSTSGYCLTSNTVAFRAEVEEREWPIFIAGDLILYLNNTLNCFLLRDRFDGSVVWKSATVLGYGRFGVVVGNRYYIYDHMGHSMCFKWEEDYASPHRPESTDVPERANAVQVDNIRSLSE